MIVEAMENEKCQTTVGGHLFGETPSHLASSGTGDIIHPARLSCEEHLGACWEYPAVVTVLKAFSC
jgi:hypothetical protein